MRAIAIKIRRNTILFILFLLVYLQGFDAGLHAQIHQYGTPLVKTYKAETYQSPPENYAVVQNENGIIYFANKGHILEYDGVTWRKLQVRGELPVLSLAIDNSGVIYASCGNEFGYLAPNEEGLLQYHSLSEKIDSVGEHVEGVGKVLISDSAIYFQTAKAVYRYLNAGIKDKQPAIATQKPVVIKAPQGFTNSFLVRGELYLHDSQNGLMELSGTTLNPFKHGTYFVKDRKTVAMLPFVNHKGRELLMLCTERHGFYYYMPRVGFGDAKFETDDESGQFYSLHAITLPSSYVLATINKGTVVIEKDVTAENRWKRRVLERYDKRAGLPSEQITSIYNNAEVDPRLLWLTSKYGISRTRINDPLRKMHAADDVKDIILGMIRHEDEFYVRTIGQIYHLKDTLNRNSFEVVEGITSNCGWITMPIEETVIQKNTVRRRFRRRSVSKPVTKTINKLFVASREGFFQIDDIKKASLVKIDLWASNQETLRSSPHDVANHYNILKIHRSKRYPYRLYLGLKDGLAVMSYQNGKWIDEGKIEGITETITSIADDPDGVLWLGVKNDGAIRIQLQDSAIIKKAPSPYSETDSLTYQLFPDTVNITRYDKTHGLPQIEEDGLFFFNDQLVFSTRKGLYRFNAAKQKFEVTHPFGGQLPEDAHIRGLNFDENGDCWLRIVDSYRSSIWLFRKAEKGYKHDENALKLLPGMTIEAMYPDKDGMVWISGTDGLYTFDTKAQRDSVQVFKTLIRKVTIGQDIVLFSGSSFLNGKLVNSPSASIELEYDHNNIKFEFAAPFFEAEEKMEFSYMLEGYDNEWSEWSHETRKEYMNLPKGDYTFRVKARNIYNEISEEGVYKFTILTPWHESWWFYALEVSTFVLLVLVSVILNRSRKKASKLTSILTMITVVAIFKLLAGLVFGPLITMFAQGITFFKILMNITVGALMFPTWAMFMNLIQYGKITKPSDAATDVATADNTDNSDPSGFEGDAGLLGDGD